MELDTWHKSIELLPVPYEEVVVITDDWRLGTAFLEGDDWVYYIEGEEEIGTVKYWVKVPEYKDE